mmetsp:Transcript_5990/g.19271  ORF Transcript_5990/g.19271 Transcript_5990/m.19271 type:complete len:203 (+) Transcript_5990:43-651(+)
MSIKERLAALQLAGAGEFVPSMSVNPTATRTRAESGETAPLDVTFERADVTSQAATGFKPKYGRSLAERDVPEMERKEDGSPISRGTSLLSGRLLKAGKGLKKNVFVQVWAVLRDEPPALTFYADEKEARTIGAPLQLDKLVDDWIRVDGKRLVLTTPAEALSRMDVAAAGIAVSRSVETRVEAESEEEAERWVDVLKRAGS